MHHGAGDIMDYRVLAYMRKQPGSDFFLPPAKQFAAVSLYNSKSVVHLQVGQDIFLIFQQIEGVHCLLTCDVNRRYLVAFLR